MANDLLNRPSDSDSEASENIGQRHADEIFSQITSKENQARDGIPGELSGGEKKALDEKTGGGGGKKGTDSKTGDSGDSKLDIKASTAAAALDGAMSATPLGRMAKAGKFLWGSRKRKQATIGAGGIAGILGGIGIFVSMTILPFKVINMVQNLQDHFFAASEQATGDMTEKLMQHYIVQKVLPGMVEHKCNSTRVSRSCAKVSDSSSIVGQLYTAWRDNNLEGKMAEKDGLEIIRTGNNQFLLKSPHLSNAVSLGTYDGTSNNGQIYARLNSRAEVRREVRRAVLGETRWKTSMHYWSVGRLMERKYGVRRCIIACDTRDKINDGVDAKKAAFTSYLTERVIAPRSEMYALALDCAMSGLDCTKDTQLESDGTHTTDFDRNVQARLLSFRETYGKTKLDDLYTNTKTVREKGITGFILEKILGQTIGEIAGKAIPIIGWIDLAAKLSAAASNASTAIHSMQYTMYAATAVQTYAVYRTSADEIHTGNVDMDVVGSIASSLDTDKTKDQGGVSANQTKLYQNLNHTGSNTSIAANILNPSAYAATDPDTTKAPLQLCNDGSKPKNTVCPELMVGNLSMIANIVDMGSKIKNSPPFAFTGMTAAAWNASVGKVLDKVGGIFGSVTNAILRAVGFGPVLDKFAEWTADLMKMVMDIVFPSPLGDKPSGGRLYETAAAGADFSGNQYAQYGIGGKKLSPAESAAIYAEQTNEAQEDFESKPLFARMFDLNSTQSFISRVALATPSSFSRSTSSIAATVFTNPFQSLIGGFSSMFSVKNVQAASGDDPFQITQFGYTQADIDAIGDPETYWLKNCGDAAKEIADWDKTATKNEETQQFENHGVDRCKLIRCAVAAGGAIFEKDLVDGCEPTANGAGSADSGAGGSFTVATYNVEGASHTDGGNKAGEPDSGPRMASAVKVMQQNGFDIIGLQEFENSQRNKFLSLAGDTYSLYPKTADYGAGHSSVNSIAYRTSMFTFVDGGTKPFLYFDGNHNTYPWVKLKLNTTGQEFIITNTHDPADTAQHHNQAQYRSADAKSHKADINNFMEQNIPVLFTGDFNSTFQLRAPDTPFLKSREGLAYCVLTDSKFVNAYDSDKGSPGHCPTKTGGPIDHIYMTSDLTASNWAQIKNSNANGYASDHNPVSALITFPGSDAGGGGGWVWPAKNIHSGPCWNADYYGSGHHAGMDMNSNVAHNPAMAAHAGTVYRKGSDGAAGNYLTIKVSDKLYYSFEHLASISVNQGDKVVAGQKVGVIGNTGNAPSNLGHLHMVVSTDGELGGYSAASQTTKNTRDPLNYLPKKAPNGYTCTNS
jgi:endonuclease/exonuclease/phosphatase family metal-dependent hydrolase